MRWFTADRLRRSDRLEVPTAVGPPARMQGIMGGVVPPPRPPVGFIPTGLGPLVASSTPWQVRFIPQGSTCGGGPAAT
jgi:hypothetical protein